MTTETKKGPSKCPLRADIKVHSIIDETEDTITVNAVATKRGVWKRVKRPADLLAQNTHWLMGRPIILNHPPNKMVVVNSEDPVGKITNAWYDETNGLAWATCVLWKAKVPPETIEKIRNNEAVEVSVGYYSLDVDETGTYEGLEYDKVETTLYFDHLALVSYGACSWYDGCGLGQRPPESVIPPSEGSSLAVAAHGGEPLALKYDEPELEVSGHSEGLNDEKDSQNGKVLKQEPGEMVNQDKKVDNMAGEGNGDQSKGKVKITKPEELKAQIEAIGKTEDPKAGLEAARGVLEGLFEDATAQIGLFKAPEVKAPEPTKFFAPEAPMPEALVEGSIPESFTWTENIDPEAVKGHTAGLLVAYMKDNLRLKKELKEATDKFLTLEGHDRNELINTIKAHGKFNDEELKAFGALPLEALRPVARNIQAMAIKGHEGQPGAGVTPFSPNPAHPGQHGESDKERLERLNKEFDGRLGGKGGK